VTKGTGRGSLELVKISKEENKKIHLQAHWGSIVQFKDIKITLLSQGQVGAVKNDAGLLSKEKYGYRQL
jgi:hypothetical protein